MKSLIRNLIIIVAILIWMTTAIIPPSSKLRLGKDLAGGFTLTYGVQKGEAGDPVTKDDIEQLTSVLMERLDPRGIYDITIVAQGTNQIEISVPAPSPEVVELRAAFEAALGDLEGSSVDSDEIDEALRAQGTDRAARLEALAGGNADQLAVLTAAAEAYDRLEETTSEYRQLLADRAAEIEPLEENIRNLIAARNALLDEAEAAGADRAALLAAVNAGEAERPIAVQELREQHTESPEIVAAIDAFVEADTAINAAEAELEAAEDRWASVIDPVEIEAADLSIAFEESRNEALRTSIDIEEVRSVLALDTRSRSYKDTASGELRELPSPREIALDRLRTQYPPLAEKIDAVTTAYDAYRAKSRGYDDPKELIRMLRGAGVLTFRIAVTTEDTGIPIQAIRQELQEGGPSNIRSSSAVRWYPLDSLEAWYDSPEEFEFLQSDTAGYFRTRRGVVAEMYDGVVYLLMYTTPERALTEQSGEWQVTGSSPTQDQNGLPAVSFQLDVPGGILFGQLTGNNIDAPMAILLDDRVYSIANIEGKITRSGQITGSFTQEDVQYLVRVLNAGSLQSRLTEEPIAQSTIGPRLGRDNLQRGVEAGILSLIVVSIFMMVYYFFAGAIANVALLSNAIIILGAMSVNRATFTMPGIAGVVLTFGMAVDANVLIFERIREELKRGVDIKTAIRLGYEKALSTIIDGNVTNLIVCVVLVLAGTAEVKGFGITLGIGIVATLFSALFITRQIFTIYTDVFGGERLSMLPIAWKRLDQLLSPEIDWIGIRKVMYVFSAAMVIAGIGLTWNTWEEMLDTEFRGGVSLTFSFGTDPETGEQITLPRAEVEQRIDAWVEQAYADGVLDETQRRALLEASILNYNVDQTSGEEFRGSSFVLKTTLTDPQAAEDAINEALGDILDRKPAIEFARSEAERWSEAPVFPVLDETLGRNIGDPLVSDNVRSHLGGVAIVLRNLTIPQTLDAIESRLDQTRQSQEFTAYIGRDVELFGLERADGEADGEALWRSVAVVVSSESTSYFANQSIWESDLASVEWEIVRLSLTEPPSLDQVTTISPAVAAQFRAKAIVSIILSIGGILVYVWIRFGSLRYSFAAVVALVHDVCVALGFLSLTHYIYDTWFGRMMLIEPFKIDLGVIAAMLTIIGYSLNDTIVILDRIRENRGKLAIASASVVNSSINQTISRTMLTSGTTLLAIAIMYWEGGTGIRGFTFAMLCGVLVGTYSSVGVAGPMVFSHAKPMSEKSLKA